MDRTLECKFWACRFAKISRRHNCMSGVLYVKRKCVIELCSRLRSLFIKELCGAIPRQNIQCMWCAYVYNQIIPICPGNHMMTYMFKIAF